MLLYISIYPTILGNVMFFLKQILGNTPIPMVFLDSDPPVTLGHFGKKQLHCDPNSTPY